MNYTMYIIIGVITTAVSFAIYGQRFTKHLDTHLKGPSKIAYYIVLLAAMSHLWPAMILAIIITHIRYAIKR